VLTSISEMELFIGYQAVKNRNQFSYQSL